MDCERCTGSRSHDLFSAQIQPSLRASNGWMLPYSPQGSSSIQCAMFGLAKWLVYQLACGIYVVGIFFVRFLVIAFSSLPTFLQEFSDFVDHPYFVSVFPSNTEIVVSMHLFHLVLKLLQNTLGATRQMILTKKGFQTHFTKSIRCYSASLFLPFKTPKIKNLHSKMVRDKRGLISFFLKQIPPPAANLFD